MIKRFIRFNSSLAYASKHTKIKGEPIPEDICRNSPNLQALAARLNLQDLPASSLARTLIDGSSTLKFVNNKGLANFGKNMLSFYVSEHFMMKYPRLPSQVHKHLVDAYTQMKPLSELAEMWGVQIDTRSPLQRHLSSNLDEHVLGKLSFTLNTNQIENGIIEVGKEGVNSTNAMGAFVRSLVTAVYAHGGLEASKQFVLDYIVKPRKLEVSKLMSFSRPTRELAMLCHRESLGMPVTRLLSESGRYSSQAVFVVGVFVNNMKIGEGQGGSLFEARTRAAVNALQGWYLYSPSEEVVLKSKSEQRAAYIDAGEIII